MDLTLLAIVGVLVIVAVSGLSPRLGIAAPLLLVVAGVGLSYVPGVPVIEIEPEVVLAGILPPLLYAASVNMPAMDFRRDLKSIGGLSVVVVVVSAVLCGLVFTQLIPDIGLGEGIALGAVLSPTDAVATSIVRRTGVAPRLVTVLEGESMLNDASALVLLRSAVAATGVSVSLWGVAWDFVLAIVVAVLIGAVVGMLSIQVRGRVHDATLNTALSFVVPFVAYAPAEHFGASGLVAVVVTGLTTGFWGPYLLRPQDRAAESTNWRTVAFLLEGGVFLLMGLVAPQLVDDFRADGGQWWRLAAATAAALGVLMAVRAVYVVLLLLDLRRDREEMRATWMPRMEKLQEYLASPDAKRHSERRLEHTRQTLARREADIVFYEKHPLGRRDGGVLVWAGMRGSITLAAAQTLPEDTVQRPLLVLVAFAVAVTTLVLQGGTLAWVVRRLGVESDREAGRREELRALSNILLDVATARCEDVEAEGLDGRPVDPTVLAQTRAQSNPHLFAAWAGLEDEERDRRLRDFRELQLAILADQRDALLEARATGRYDSAVLGQVLRRVDAGEISLGQGE
jgi:monovalent cation/hydrogen antiporter